VTIEDAPVNNRLYEVERGQKRIVDTLSLAPSVAKTREVAANMKPITSTTIVKLGVAELIPSRRDGSPNDAPALVSRALQAFEEGLLRRPYAVDHWVDPE
jgi:hypothetical protein